MFASLEELAVSVLTTGAGLFFGFVGIVFLYGGLILTTRWLKLRNQSPDTLYDTGGNETVVLEGSAEAASETLTSPVSGTECLSYDYTVETYDRASEGDNWEIAASGDESVPFLLETDSGTVYVDTESPLEVDVGDDETEVTVASDEEPPEPTREFLRANDDVRSELDSSANLTEVLFGTRRRYSETVFRPGETAFASGRVEDVVAADERIPSEATAVLRGEDGGLPLVSEFTGSPSFVADASMDTAVVRQRNNALVALAIGSFLTLSAAGVLFGI